MTSTPPQRWSKDSAKVGNFRPLARSPASDRPASKSFSQVQWGIQYPAVLGEPPDRAEGYRSALLSVRGLLIPACRGYDCWRGQGSFS
ncbi:hypothetical protein ACJ73_00871, partial [Blastomyces percursus]